MNRFSPWCLVFSLTTCFNLAASSGHFQVATEPPLPASPMPSSEALISLQKTFQLYLTLSQSHQDAFGFIEWQSCDSLLFTGLYGAIEPLERVTIEAARDKRGAWHRRSLHLPECYPSNSGSTISRDMLLGLLWFIWEKKRLDLADHLFHYGQKHHWLMGRGDISRTLFSPALQATLAEIIYRLGGKNHRKYRKIPQLYKHNIGYAAHLDVLSILLRARLLGGLSAQGLKIVKYNYQRVPRNPLFAYVYHRYTDRDQTETLSTLLHTAIFPSHRLPTQHDRCSSWISQRDPGKDWQPCRLDEPAETFSGGDFIFVAGLVLED